MIKKIQLLVIILPILLNTLGHAERPQLFDKEGTLTYSRLKTLFKESSAGDVNSVKDLLKETRQTKKKSTQALSSNVLIMAAKNAALEGHIEIFRMLYIANPHQKKDKILIPSIRCNGYLDLFYISLVRNGDIRVLEKLMKKNHLLTTDTRNAIFETALTIYGRTNGFKGKDKHKRVVYKCFMNRQLNHVDQLYQTRYKRSVLNEVTLPKHIFSAAEQDTFDQESARWMHFSF